MSESIEASDALSNSANHNPNISGTPGSGASASSIAADPNAFIKYLKQFVPALLDANNNINDFDKCFNDKANVESIKKFVAESQVRTLIIQKFLSSKGKRHRLGIVGYYPKYI